MTDALLDIEPERRSRKPKHPTSDRKDYGQLGMFEALAIRTSTRLLAGMVRGESPIESQVAAAKVLPMLSDLQALVLRAIREAGTLTAKEAEGMTEYIPEFKPYSKNTIRKRFTDLKQMGAIVQKGEERREGCAVMVAV